MVGLGLGLELELELGLGLGPGHRAGLELGLALAVGRRVRVEVLLVVVPLCLPRRWGPPSSVTAWKRLWAGMRWVNYTVLECISGLHEQLADCCHLVDVGVWNINMCTYHVDVRSAGPGWCVASICPLFHCSYCSIVLNQGHQM